MKPPGEDEAGGYKAGSLFLTAISTEVINILDATLTCTVCHVHVDVVVMV